MSRPTLMDVSIVALLLWLGACAFVAGLAACWMVGGLA